MGQHETSYRLRPDYTIPLTKGKDMFKRLSPLMRIYEPFVDDNFLQKNCILLALYLHYYTKSTEDVDSTVISEFFSYWEEHEQLTVGDIDIARKTLPTILSSIKVYQSDILYVKYNSEILPYEKELLCNVYSRLSLWLIFYSLKQENGGVYNNTCIFNMISTIKDCFPYVKSIPYTGELQHSKPSLYALERKLTASRAAVIALVFLLIVTLLVFGISWGNAQEQFNKKNAEIVQLQESLDSVSQRADKDITSLEEKAVVLKADNAELEKKVVAEYRRGFENGFSTGVTAEHDLIHSYTKSRSVYLHETFYELYGLPDELFFD